MKKDFVKKIQILEKNSFKVSRDVHFMNDKRAKIKSKINQLSGSNIREVKEYTEY